MLPKVTYFWGFEKQRQVNKCEKLQLFGEGQVLIARQKRAILLQSKVNKQAFLVAKPQVCCKQLLAPEMGSRTTTSTTFFSVLNSSRGVVNVEVDVQGPRQAEDVDKEDAQYQDEQAKTSRRAPIEHPVKEQYKADREKGGKNV